MRIRIGLFLLASAALLLFSGCAVGEPRGITQVNTIDSLLAGVYDGNVTLAELGRSGDCGIGTFDRLDGEMLLLDGVFYQIGSDGKVRRPSGGVTTPFAAVVRFEPELTETLGPASYAKVRDRVDALIPNRNLFAAVRLHGTFRRMHTRSVPAQEKPYPPLAEVTKHQPEFELENVKGTVFGFRLPQYVKGINVPGYHLHFIDDAHTCGGHILGFELESGVLSVETLHRFTMILPEDSAAFAAADLARDRGRELHQVESAR